MLYHVFVRSIYEYGLHLVPLTLLLKPVISRLESCFFRLVMRRGASRFGSSRLPRLPSLCQLESVDVRRIIMGHQRPSCYKRRRIAALQVPKTDPNRMPNFPLPANNSPCSYPTLASCGCGRALTLSPIAAIPFSGKGNGAKPA